MDAYPNEGEAEFAFQTKDGQQMTWLFQIAEVNKTLASVSALVDSGHVVTFNRDEKTGIDTSFITHEESWRSTKMRRESGVFRFDMWVKSAENAKGADNVEKTGKSVFNWLGEELIQETQSP